jgi:hypothetical protein
MSNRSPFLAIAICLLFTVACKKSNHSGNSGPNPLTGTSWKFDGETTKADITSTASIGPISVTVINLINFQTLNNVGSFTFTADSLGLVGVGYTIDTTYTSITSSGGITDTLVSPLTDTAKPLNTSVTYQLIGQDSIYFPNGSPFKLNVDSIQPPIQLSGAHFTISGSTLTFTSSINLSGNETIHGITAPTTGPITSVITLTKQ